MIIETNRKKFLNIFYKINTSVKEKNKNEIDKIKEIEQNLHSLKEYLENYGYHHDFEFREIEPNLFYTFTYLLQNNSQKEYSDLLDKFINYLGMKKQHNFKTNINYQINILQKEETFFDKKYRKLSKDLYSKTNVYRNLFINNYYNVFLYTIIRENNTNLFEKYFDYLKLNNCCFSSFSKCNDEIKKIAFNYTKHTFNKQHIECLNTSMVEKIDSRTSNFIINSILKTYSDLSNQYLNENLIKNFETLIHNLNNQDYEIFYNKHYNSIENIQNNLKNIIYSVENRKLKNKINLELNDAYKLKKNRTKRKI